MSHTYRRRNTDWNYSWVLLDWSCRCFPLLWVDVWLDRHSPEGRQKLARYHADMGTGRWGSGAPPHWYRRSRNKIADRSEEQHLHLWRKNDEYEVPMRRRVRDASWYW